MDNLSEIIKKRSTPGTLIFDLEGRLLYSNSEALEIMPILNETIIKEGEVVPNVPSEVLELCRKLKENELGSAAVEGFDRNSVILFNGASNPCSLRAFPIGNHGSSNDSTHIMVLLESIVEKHEPDFEKVRLDFILSKREMDVLRLIYRGFSYKTISENIFISEFTVKDHIKNIMQKMNVRSRGELTALLK